ncbi:MAG TPA: glycosyltransferase [Solirubrobacterales bacterium]|nr:glycosyltransferase [Solirubrobacterales bacterium]
MRIAIVTPYSWTYPGGVNRHVEALADELLARGHELRVLAPWDDPDRTAAAILHRSPAQPRRRPDYVVPLGRTVGIGANGAVSNLGVFPGGVTAMRRELRAFGPDVVHVHEPPAPFLSWDACSFPDAPVVGTFHAYSTKPVPNQIANLLGARRKLNQLRRRIAVSEAAAWTGRRWFGGEYEVIPNGVDVGAAPQEPKPESGELRVLFVGRPEERKGMPVLLQAFEALIEHVPARLHLVGPEPDEVRRYLADPGSEARIDALGRVDRERLWRELHAADVLSAPSLSGESFGMILTEAFAAGTPVVASNIAGYAGVVTDRVDGVLVPAADPQALAEELQALHHEPERRIAMGRAARESAKRYAWPRIAERVEDVYQQARYRPSAASSAERLARRAGLVPADGGPPRPARRLPSLDPAPPGARSGSARIARRAGLGLAAALGLGLAALAANRIGLDRVVNSIVGSDLSWVLVATGLMMSSLLLRAVSWFQIARSALPRRPLRRRDVTSATMIGVLMSATLPARLGEPARAMVLARRTGWMRETFPVLLGTLVSQTTLNVLALGILGGIVLASTDLFHAGSQALFLASLTPLALLLTVLGAPYLLRRNGSGRLARIVGAVRDALVKVRSGLRVFRDPRRGPVAAAAQLGAWGLQLLACLALFTALGLDSQAGIAAAAAVLFAVNVTAVVPATPSNIGIFQLATITVLTAGFGVGAANALAYGVILQAVEFATAVALGVPALVREGVTWSDMRMRALQSAPVRLRPRTGEEPVST